MSPVDIIIKDKDGNVTADSKRDRIDKLSSVAEQIYKHHSDFTLQKMLKSYESALKDPQNEFFYLYEIIDALKTRFGSKKKALHQLKNADDPWNDLGKITNESNRKEGRHRGQSEEKLQKSTKSELKAARKDALKLIEKYLAYLALSNQY